uniref:Uncharacterized protein n=1 Tax=Utricularia reniformis TaxID=192314 RepID=A0A1Y0B3N6_9LAMI|nr:hypothetical protein AEK19_MT1897 [Utricularia reniformis]ART32065.1 hypothetical protein AEK19_MT1897 [Utricularia reniformis]
MKQRTSCSNSGRRAPTMPHYEKCMRKRREQAAPVQQTDFD